MLVLLGTFIIAIIAIIFSKRCVDDGWETAWVIIALLFTGGFVGEIIIIPINRLTTRSEVYEFIATKRSIDKAREKGVDVENAAIQHKIIEQNQWLAKVLYYKRTVWGLWIPEEVKGLEPIE